MKIFYIIANSDKEECIRLSGEIAEYLTAHGQKCLIRKGKDSYDPEVGQDVDGILVLGGDGTLLRAARDLAGRKIPFLGINLGHLGYLAEIEEQNVTAALDRLIEGCYTVENRMMLEGTVYRVVNYDVYVNDEYLNSFTADGMIVSTPTGSTGYSLSAGGPIVSPTASMLVLTPICPHTLNSRSIVFSGDDRIRIEIGEGRRNGPDEACVTFDGDTCEELKTGDYVEIHKSCEVTKILKINQVSFLEVLRDKLSRR